MGNRVLDEVLVILNTTRITVKPEKGIELGQTVSRLLSSAKDMTGCRSFRFYQDVLEQDTVLLVSEWDKESDLNNFLRSNTFAILSGAIKVLSSSSVDSKAFLI